uniref:Esterase-like activity of phytase family protein n=1 Tax=Phenylobacterium glaciei TaxID=2803784 RepID=A0A974P761_9CAUL|nr:esterase-like activity of phytase family protein [Phenylobacterium glaciei]
MGGGGIWAFVDEGGRRRNGRTALDAEGLAPPGAEDILPAQAGRRRLNRGFEGLAVSADETRLYAGFQSAFENDDADATRIWTLDAATGALLAEHSYPFDPPESFLRDVAAGPVGPGALKIGELLCVGDSRLLVLERISHTSKIYAVDLARNGPLAKHLIFTSDDAPRSRRTWRA